MRLLHLADLHIGRRVCEMPLLDDQRFVLGQILERLERGEADVVLVAGDVYDKSQPASEAVALVDWFFSAIADVGVPAIVIPGNHDSAERVAYASSSLERRGIHVAPVFDGHIAPVELADESGPVHVWPIPFLRPATIRHFLPDGPTDTYTQAFQLLVGSLPLDPDVRNVALVHQFLTSGAATPERSDSEVSVGGLDNVDVGVFDAFDYVAAGHIHRPQGVGRPSARYAGSLLKYSLSEARYDKSAPLVTLGRKGSEPHVELLPLTPLHDLRRIRGPLESLISPEVVSAADADDYLHVILTDESPRLNALARLRDVYPNVMAVEYDNARRRAIDTKPVVPGEDAGEDPLALFEDFYRTRNGSGLSGDQRAIVREELEGVGVVRA